MRDLVDYLARGLVDRQESVNVTEQLDGDRSVYRVTVDESDLGKIIGPSCQ